MTVEAVDVVQRWFEDVWNQKRAEVVEELLSENSICHGEGSDIAGAEGFRTRFYEPLTTAFPDLRLTIEGTLAQGNQAVVRWSAVGTHTGPGIGTAPTGKTVEFRGMTWLKVVDGKLSEGWQSSNIAEVLRGIAT